MNSKINALLQFGEFLKEYKRDTHHDHEFTKALDKAYQANGWFDTDQLDFALKSWGQALQKQLIENWTDSVALPVNNPKMIGLVLAGNIPFVGLHDLLCVWLSGHRAIVKTASKDPYLLPAILRLLETYAPQEKGRIQFTDKALQGYDAVIATGSDNAARYFDYYFSHVPHLIRKNRNGVAVLDGSESTTALSGLAEDMLRYYGLGCRNVAQLFLPKGYDLDLIFRALYPFHSVIQIEKYAHNYDYNKAVFLMSDIDFLENGFFMLRESLSWSAPIATVSYHYYESLEELQSLLEKEKERIQCVVSELALPGAISLGQAQHPQLWDYADGKNTLHFLQNL